MKTIPKSELKDGGYYVGRTYQRGMPIGLWDEKKQNFVCIKPPQFGQFSLYEMNHIEDDDGYVCFEPVEKLEFNFEDKKGNPMSIYLNGGATAKMIDPDIRSVNIGGYEIKILPSIILKEGQMFFVSGTGFGKDVELKMGITENGK